MGEGRRRKAAQEQRMAQLQSLPTSHWPLSHATMQAQFEEMFNRLGIDFSQPGFQDSLPFLKEEARRPEILDDYARYVEVRNYTEAELADARRKIEAAAEVVSEAIRADGRHGLCIVASGVLARILDRLGVWNFCAKATLTISFPPAISMEKRMFFAIDEGRFEAPHAIVVAPPFLVVDTTAAAQSYDIPAMSAAIPPLIMQREFIPYEWADEDIAAPEIRVMLAKRGLTLRGHLQQQNPPMLKRMKDFPGRSATFPGGSLAYVITGIGGYVEKIDDLTHHTHLAGQSPMSLLEDRIRPKLAGFGPTA